MTNFSNENEEIKQKRARADRLRYLREEVLRLSRAEMQQKLGLSESSIENWEYARYSGLTERGAKKIRDICQQIGINCTEQWLLYGIGQKPTSAFLKQLNKFMGHDDVINEIETITEELKTFHQLNPGAIDSMILDESLLPCYFPDDYVAGIQYFGKDIEKAIGKVCIVKSDNEIAVGLLRKGTSSQHFSLSSTNPDYNTVDAKFQNITLVSAAPIIWIRRRNSR